MAQMSYGECTSPMVGFPELLPEAGRARYLCEMSPVEHQHVSHLPQFLSPAEADALCCINPDITVHNPYQRPLATGSMAPELEPEEQWVFFPWRNSLAPILTAQEFYEERTNRNRNKITAHEQARLSELNIAIVGLSVGHAIALTLTLEGVGGHLRLADPDFLELSNLNRVPTSLLDIGVNKSVSTARRIAEINPYLDVEVFPEGVTEENVFDFIDGVDIVIEECDSFDIKVIVREACRERGIPVVMETSDGGILDIERFDLEPDRPFFHGLTGELDAAGLVGMDRATATPLAAKILEPPHLSARMAASLMEIDHTLSAWPQLGGDVLLGGATVSAAVRRLALGRPLPSGRVRFDREARLDQIQDPLAVTTAIESRADLAPIEPSQLEDLAAPDLLAYVADRAPSAGNQHPWCISVRSDGVTITLDTAASSSLDIGHRASAVAVGAAVMNAQIAALSRRRQTRIEFVEGPGSLLADVSLGTGPGPRPHGTAPDALTRALARSTRRGFGASLPISDEHQAALTVHLTTPGARVHWLTEPGDISECADILAESDRIRFLTPHLHREMFSEIAPGTSASRGITLPSLALTSDMEAMFKVLGRPDVMSLLDEWDAGDRLGKDSRDRALSASAFALLIQTGSSLTDYARGGMRTEEFWLNAERLGYAVHPMTPIFMYATDDDSARAISPTRGPEVAGLRRRFIDATGLETREIPTILLRLSHARYVR